MNSPAHYAMKTNAAGLESQQNQMVELARPYCNRVPSVVPPAAQTVPAASLL
jgi:hypothetical protein